MSKSNLPAQNIEGFADAFFRDRLQKQIPGAIVVVVEDGHIALKKGYGFADVEKNRRMDPEKTWFPVGSISKLFTATAAMQLYDKGLVGLEGDVNQYVQDADIKAMLNQPLTVHHLLTHTGGFGDRNLGAAVRELRDQLPLREDIKQHVAPIRPPGQEMMYDNSGMQFLGYVVESVAKMPFNDYMTNHVFKPLNMRTSTFRATPDLLTKIATGYQGSNGIYKPYPTYVLKSQDAPQGGLLTTGADIARFMLSHLEQTPEILKKETYELMHRQQYSYDHRVPGVGYGFWQNRWNGVDAIGHNGDLPGFRSAMWLLPDKHAGLFVAINGDSGAELRNELMNAFITTFYSEEKDLSKPASLFQGDALPDLSGTYRYNRYTEHTFEKLNLLLSPKEIKVNMIDQGEYNVNLFPDQRFRQIDSSLLKSDEGNYVAVKRENNGEIRSLQLYSHLTGSIIVNKITWFESATFHLFLFAVFSCLFLILTLWGIAKFIKRKPRQPFDLFIWIANVLHLVFIAGLVGSIASIPSFEYEFGIPKPITSILTIPLIALSLSVITSLLWLKTRKKSGYYFFSITLQVCFFVFLSYWRLLP
ncbi:beta-lactamase family protein [Brevibacillus invocatus]|nr:serine hydrolase domain-containing protein [Brevibacillus invocatus]MCM3081942.1 beta-lactamase family protein [Brevibacillus invocatus]